MSCKAGFFWCCVSLVQNLQKEKLQTAKQLLYIIVMRWTTKEIKMQLQVFEG